MRRGAETMKPTEPEINDAAERARALDPAASFIVRAPAGSGKTELLMQRYLALLALAERPEEILALTFTRKAAGEMSCRIIDSLEGAAAGRRAGRAHERTTLDLAVRVMERDRELGWRLLENPARLKVQTIDSFSASLVAQMPLLSRLGARPGISDAADELYAEAVRRTLEMVEGKGEEAECVRDALAHMDNSMPALGRRLVAMLRTREQWMRRIGAVPDETGLRARLEQALARLIEESLERARSAFPPGLADRLNPLAWYAASNVDEESPIHALAGLDGAPDASAGSLLLWKGLRTLLLTGKNTLRKDGGVNKRIGFPADATDAATAAKGDFRRLLASLEDEPAFIDALSAVRDLPQPHYGDAEWEILFSLIRLLPVCAARLAEVFAEEGLTDYPAVSMAALEALGTETAPTDLMLSLDLRIRHILVDEYQDTSYAQLSLLTALTRGWEEGDGRTLFIVGDPMQSIYLFREAEVGLFLEAARSGIGALKMVPLVLKSNFRSLPGIVSWVNASFEKAFPALEDAFTGAIPYSSSRPAIPARSDGPDGAEVRVHLYNGRDDEAEARRVLALINEAKADGTVAVLCRSRAHLYRIMDLLVREGTAFKAEEMIKLSKRPVIQDLFSLLRAVLHPFDRVAWLAVLRAPWCGLTLADLHALCSDDKKAALLDLLGDAKRMERLSADGRRRAARTAAALGRALGARGRVETRTLLESLWLDLGGPACVDDASMTDAETFFSLVESLSAAAAPLSTGALTARIEGLFAGHGNAAGADVELMTVHRAKGLEFDHVIIPGTGRTPGHGEKRLLVWMDWKEDLFLAPVEKKEAGSESPIYDYLRSIDAKKQELEAARIFYVACTRARKRLHILGHAKIETTPEDGEVRIVPEKRSLLRLIDHLLAPEMVVGGQDAGQGAGPERRRPGLKRLPERAAPVPAPAVATLAGLVRTTPDERPEFDWAGRVARHTGTIVHAYLCRIASDGLEMWNPDRTASESRAIRASLRSLGLGSDEAERASERCMEIINGALEDETGRWVLGPHESAEAEKPLTGVIDAEIKRCVMDRTFVERRDGREVRWIIDYKTGSHEGGSVDGFVASERERYAAQLERYAALLRAEGETREIRKALYFPALKRLEVIE